MQRILIVNPFGIGDVLFTTPLLANLRTHIPEAHIGYVVNRRAAAVLEHNPAVNKVFIYERDEFDALYRRSPLDFVREARSFFKSIGAERFDTAIDLSLNAMFGFWLFAAGIPQRVGFDHRGRGRFLTRKFPLAGYEGRHVAEHYLDLLRALGVPAQRHALQFPVSRQDELWADLFYGKHGLAREDERVAVVPGGGASWGRDAAYKRWPAQRFAELADKIVENFKSNIILLGDEKETDLCRDVQGRMKSKAVLACGRTTLGQCGSLLKRCRLAVVNDGGPLHIAVASGVPTVSIFGPVDEGVYGPYPREGHEVVSAPVACRPCYRQFRRAQCDHVSCLSSISVEDVLERVRRSLTSRRG